MDLKESEYETVDRSELAQEKSHAGSCEHGKEPLHSIKCREFLDQLSTYQPLQNGSIPWT
jgi:hypothetical protein